MKRRKKEIDENRKKGVIYLNNTLELIKMGYLNLTGTVKALLKSMLVSLALIAPIGMAIFLTFLNMFLGSVILSIITLILVVLMFLLFPIVGNTNVILMREYILNESRIGIGDAFKEAKERLKGRYLIYYLKSLGLGLLTFLVAFLCGITIIGILLLPIITYTTMIAQISLAYQNEMGPINVIKVYMKELALLSLALCLISFVSGLIPVVGTILALPALCAPQLFVALKFD